MLSPRVKRLNQDYELLCNRFANWPLIQITGTAGLPPEVYRFTYSIKGLFVSASGEIQERDTHVLEVNLSLGYPRRAPQCRMLTPVFHPNFDDATVCIGDFWAASEGLDELLLRVGRMITYQEYNTKSPLNGLAAKWAAQNQHLLPVDPREIAPAGEVVSGVQANANGNQPVQQAAATAAEPASNGTGTVATSDPRPEKITIP